MPLAEFSQFITADGTVYPLDGLVERSLVVQPEGQGMPSIDYITQKGPLQHGETVIAYKLKPRVIQMVFRRNAKDRQGYWNARAELLDILRPNRLVVGTIPTSGVLRKILPNHAIRDINVLIDTGPIFAQSADVWDEWSYQEALRFIAYDPTYYDPTSIMITQSVAVVTQIVFPISFPISFGSGHKASIVNTTYLGTWLSYPVIKIYGPLNTLVLDNLTTGEQIQFTHALSAGEIVTIDLRFGYKTVTDANGINLIGSTDGDLGTFHLEAAPLASGGVNQLQFYIASAGTGYVTLEYLTRYIGV